MKKIINGKVYNTDTATKLGEWYTEGRTCGDFNYCEETLYKTKNGQYFIYGKGGPLTKYSVSCGNNSYSGSSNIILIDEVEAMEWAEYNLDVEEYIDIFGEIEEG